mmetsp:Transcript_26299/g.53391  ORF Transcript_26299/g.53391 Transcript_26299/m.53391 type:complete len:115 (-) Transcript_26299:3977-4321(-)
MSSTQSDCSSAHHPTIMYSKMVSLVAVLAFVGLASAFSPLTTQTPRLGNSQLAMAPKFDPSTQKWETTGEEDLEGAYGPIGSLIRAGPKPFLIRLLNQDQYEQGEKDIILKYYY